MADIFDTLEAESKADIFDRIEPLQDESPVDLEALDAMLMRQNEPSTVRSTTEGGPPVALPDRFQTGIPEVLDTYRENLFASPLDIIPPIPTTTERKATLPEKIALGAVMPATIGPMLQGGEAGEIPVGVARRVANAALGLGKFVTSPAGVATAGAAMAGAIPAFLVSAGFTADMLVNLVEQGKQTYADWKKMTWPQRAEALTDILTTGGMAGLAGTHAVRTGRKIVADRLAKPEAEVEATAQAFVTPEKAAMLPETAKAVEETSPTPPERKVDDYVEPEPTEVVVKAEEFAEKPAAPAALAIEAEKAAYRASAALEKAEQQQAPESVLEPLRQEVERTEKEAIAAEEAAEAVGGPDAIPIIQAEDVSKGKSSEGVQGLGEEVRQQAAPEGAAQRPATAEVPVTSTAPAAKPAEEVTAPPPTAPEGPSKATEVGPPLGAALGKEMEPLPLGPAATKFRAMDEAREARQLEPLLKPQSVKDQQVLDRALAEYDKDAEGALKLAEQIKQKPRTLEDWENHYILLRWIDTRDAFYKAAKEEALAWDEGRLSDLDRLKDVTQGHMESMSTLEEALRMAGTQAGRALRARQVLIKEDFTLDRMVMQKRAAKGGADLTAEEMAQLSALEKTYKDKTAALEKHLAASAARVAELEAAKALAETRAVQSTPQAAAQRRARAASGVTPQQTIEKVTERISLKIEKDETANITPLVKKLAESLWESGVRELKPMIDALQGILKDFLPDISRQETMDALSGRGRFWQANQAEVKKGVRDLSTQARLVAHQIDVEARRPLPRTGFQPDKMSDAARREEARLNELKRKFGVVVTDPAAQLASALQASKTYLRNRMADLRQEISTREKIVKTKTPLTPDAELEALRAEYEQVKAEHGQIFTKPELTPEQRAAMAEKAVDRAIASMEADLQAGRLQPVKKPSLTAETASLMEKRAWLAALRDHRQELRDIANPKATLAQRLLSQKKARMTQRIAELTQKIAEGNFTRKPRKPPVMLDEAGAMLKGQLETIKRQFERGLELDKLRNQTIGQKIYRRAKETLNLPRNILSSWDLSAVLRQGGFISFGHPIRAAKSIVPMLRSLASQEATAAIEQQILSRPNAPLYAQSKLYLAPHDAIRLSLQEEQIMSDWGHKVPGVRASNRAFVTFLNKLRADSFDAMVDKLGSRERPLAPEELKAIANYVNVATGRGSLGKTAGAAEFLATAFFSPRLLASRFQLLAGEPLYHGSAATRKAIAGEYARFLGGLSVVYALGALSGATIETDPRSADFGKLKFGNTRVDPLTGLSQTSVLLGRLGIGEVKTARGKVLPIRGKVPYGASTGADLIARFLRSKLSPIVGTAVDIASGENVVGEKVTGTSVAQHLVVPLSFQEIYDVMLEQGVPKGVALEMLSIFGMGLQHYEPGKK